jgi:hypothetical protein
MSRLDFTYADEAQEKEAKRLEKKIRQAYSEAEGDLKVKLKDYLDKFEVKLKYKKEALAKGEITPEFFQYWVTGQVLIGERWEEMVMTMAEDLTKTHQLAYDAVTDSIFDTYALNHNYATFQVEKNSLIDTSYTLYDRNTVELLLKDNKSLLPKPKVKVAKDIAWNKKNIRSAITQSILQGEGIIQTQKRLMNAVGMSEKQAMRNARTALTGAQNAGRYDGLNRARDMGINVYDTWLATLDGITRDSHRHLDGEKKKKGKDRFSNGCRYPGDPQGRPEEVYNCRCTMTGDIEGFETDYSDLSLRQTEHLGGLTYEQWKTEKSKATKTQTKAVTKSYTERVQSAKSTDDINKILDTSGFFRDDSVNDLSGVDLDLAKDIANTYDNIMTKFPILKGRLGGVTSKTLSSHIYAQASLGYQNVEVNVLKYSSLSNVVESYKKDLSYGFHPEGTNYKSVITHEIGHTIDGLLTLEGVGGAKVTKGKLKCTSDFMRKEVCKEAGTLIKDTQKDVSFYATKNAKEWFAECFAEYVDSENPRVVAKTFGKKLSEYLDEFEKKVKK